MKNTLKIFIITLILIFCANIYFVQAASFVFTAKTDNSNVKQGDTIIIEFSISDIDVEGSGINTISAKLEYDKNVFDQVLSTNFSGDNNWSITYNDEEGESEGNLLAVIVEDGVNTSQVIGKLKLRVKDEIEDTQTQVKITDIVTNDGKEEILGQDQVVTIKIEKPVEENQNENEHVENENIKPSSNNNGSNINSGNSNKPLPFTGEELSIIIIVALSITIITGIIAYICLKKEKEVK